MGKIRILPDILVSKISAGEVVERPASVVKELIENSIDASADKITIFLKSGGKRQIKVIDNGYGMTRDDALMSLERHATSKIKDVNDLFSLDTLGFRGEAIPSVASVSRLNIITKTDEQQSGVEINSEGGVIKKVKEVACNTGTSIEVNNLFFNTPARLKFLKKPQTELMRVMEIIQREAISMPRIQFEVFSEDKNLYHYKSTTDIKSRITEIIPNTELYEFESENKGVEINVYLSSPLESRTSLQKLYTYVNNRSVRDRFINRLVMDSYGNLLDKGRFPQGVIFIIVDHKDVDVNVHPTKIEVKFKNQYFVGECIKESIKNMLNGAPWIKGYKMRAENALNNYYESLKQKQSYKNIKYASERNQNKINYNDHDNSGTVIDEISRFREDVFKESEYRGSDDFLRQGYYSRLKLIGQIGKLYLICESEEGLIVVDQHAAHERVNFERVKKAYLEDNKLHSQELLIPEVLELTPQEISVADSNSVDIFKLGFNYEQFGENTIRIKSVPGFLLNSSYKEIFLNLLNEIYNFGNAKSIKEQLDLVCATIACHGSVRANQKLSSKEIEHLFEDLDKTEFPHSCPHGRPIATEISYNMLEKMFRRA